MKIPKAKDNTFKINDHVIKVRCICKPLCNASEKSVYKKVCSVTFIHDKDNKTELVTLNMKSAAQLILNHLDFNTMTVEIFGNKTNITDIIIKRNLRVYTVEEIDDKAI